MLNFIKARLIPLLFYILFFFVPLVLYPKTSELFEFNKIVLTYGLTVLIVSAWTIKCITARKIIFRRTILDKALLIFLGAQLLSTIFSIDTYTSVFGYYSRFHGGLVSQLAYTLLYWAYASNMDRRGTIKSILFLLSSAVLVSVYAVLQHFGIDKDIWVQDVQNRVFSTLGQPNWLATWLVALLPLTWWLLLKSKLKNNWLWIGISSLFFLVVLYTKSRSGLLGFVFALTLYWGGLYVLNKNKLKNLRTPFVIVCGVLIFFIAVTGTPWTPKITELGSRSEEAEAVEGVTIPALELGGTESADIRRIVWRGALNLWKNNPIFGTGVETFAHSYYRWRPVEHNLVSEWDFLYNKAHNEYLNFAANTGTVGLISYLFLIGTGSFLIFSLAKSSKRNHTFYLALLAGYISIHVSNFFGFSVVPVALLTFLFPAFAVGYSTRGKQLVTNTKRASLTTKQKSLLSLLLFITFYLLILVGRYWYADTIYTAGRLQNDSGNYSAANELLKRSVGLTSLNALFWDELSQSFVGLALTATESANVDIVVDYVDQAIINSDKALELSPSSVGLRRSQASMYLKLSEVDQAYLVNAVEALTEATKLAPTDAKLFYNLGLAQARMGQIDTALTTLENAVKMKANYRNARFALGLIYADVGRFEEGRAQLEYILEFIAPDDTLVQQQLLEI